MWIVRLTDQRMPYGPFDDRASADRFRELRGEPAEIEQLHDPVTELLNRIDAPREPTWAWSAAEEAAYREEQGT